MVNRGGVATTLARARVPIILTLLVLGGIGLLRRDASPVSSGKNSAFANPDGIRAAFGHLPLSFEPNQGQEDGRVKFLARGTGYGLYLTSTEAVMAFGGSPSRQSDSSAIEMRFGGANPNAEIAGSDQLPGHSNYFIGNDPSRWHRNIPQFARVAYRNVYPGIDLAFYGRQGRLEYDFEVNPGSDPGQIQLNLAGADSLSLAPNGDLVLVKDGRELRFQAPHVYQKSGRDEQPVRGSFVLRGNQQVAFQVSDYDRSRTLVIDPIFVYSTYLGGSGNESCGVIVNGSQSSSIAHCPAIAVDSASRVYVAGATTSTGTFSGVTPAPIGPLSSTNVFVTRLNSTGTALDYVTYLGGSGAQYPTGVGVDSGFNVYVAGTTTSSTDFPTTPTAFQATPVAAGMHVFFSKLDSSGSANLYTTFLAGSGTDTASDLAVDKLGSAYIFGITNSPDFPHTPGALQTAPKAAGAQQFFFSKVNPGSSGASSLPYSTYLGGGTPATGSLSGGAIAVDSNFNVYVAGGTTFTDMPTVNAYKSASQGGVDVWAARLNAPPNNTQQYTPLYETYFGGSGADIPFGVATDGTNTYITGSTTSSGLPAGTGTTPFQASLAGGSDAFIAKFGVPATTGTTQGSVPLSYFTYLGGSSNDAGLAIAVDSVSDARVTGWTQLNGFPNTTPLPGSPAGTSAFIARIVTTGTSTANVDSTSILGGSGTDIGTSIALDSSLNTYVAGETSSPNFVPGGVTGLSNALSGPTDAFVSKLGPNPSGLTFVCAPAGCPASNPTVTPTPVNVGGNVTFTYTIYNLGDPVTGVVFTANIGANTTFSSATASSGSCGTATGGTVVCNLGTVNSSTINSTTSVPSSAATVTIVVTATTQVLQQPVSIGSVGTLTVPGTSFSTQTSGPDTVNDFSVMVTPASATVIAGTPATYVAQVSPVGAGGFPASVSLACGSGLPSGAGCQFTNNPIPNLTNGAQSRTFEITTTARVTTPGNLFIPKGFAYAFWLPIFGAGLIGAGISRKRRLLLAVFFAAVLGIGLLQLGCGSSSSRSSTTTGTPAGTYTVTVNATAGATRTTTVQLTVQ
jgi:uncharacterized protein DUF11/beta-propeller repeat-containing protein